MQRLGILSAFAAVFLFVTSSPAAEPVDLVGRGSIGASAGIMKFYTGQNFKEGDLRFIGEAQFKYNFSEHFAGEFTAGFGWNAYPIGDTDEDTLAVVAPVIFGLEYRNRIKDGPVFWHGGGGGGLYFLGIKNEDNKWAQGNNGTETLKWTSPGLYGKLGVEHLWNSGASMNLDFLTHYIFSDDSAKFPDGWGNQNTGYWEIRVGVNYYFRIKGDKKEGDKEEESSD